MASNESIKSQCEPCDIAFKDDDLYQRHLQSPAHKAQVLCRQNPAVTEDSDSEEDNITSEIICNICHKSFSGVVPYKQHLQSAQHLKILEKERLTAKLVKDPKKKKDIKHHEDHDADTPLVPEAFASCSTCKKDFSGPKAYQLHILSKKHARKLEEKKFLENVKVADKDAENIIKFLPEGIDESVSHKIMSELKEKLIISSSTTSDDASEEAEEPYFCKECNKVFSSVVPYLQHMVSNTHAKKVKQIQMMKTLFEQEAAEVRRSDTKHGSHSPDACSRRVKFVDGVMHCDICRMAFSGPENVKAHVKSRGHQNKLEEIKFKAELAKQNFTATSEKKHKVPILQRGNQLATNEIGEPSMSNITDVGAQPSTEFSITKSPFTVAMESESNVDSKDDPSDTCLNEEEEKKENPTLSESTQTEHDDKPKKTERKKKSNIEKVTETVKDIIENDL